MMLPSPRDPRTFTGRAAPPWAAFSPSKNVRRLTPVLDETLADLLRRFKGFAQTETPFAINPALQAATKDVIQNYALGKGVKCLDQEDFNAAFFAAWQSWRPCAGEMGVMASSV
ncbi:hypothetical protein VDGD_05994 [Verticillium dahliae]|nr:hypothetical protein VDGD_05994 [Verticillium dahliae]